MKKALKWSLYALAGYAALTAFLTWRSRAARAASQPDSAPFVTTWFQIATSPAAVVALTKALFHQ